MAAGPQVVLPRAPALIQETLQAEAVARVVLVRAVRTRALRIRVEVIRPRQILAQARVEVGIRVPPTQQAVVEAVLALAPQIPARAAEAVGARVPSLRVRAAVGEAELSCRSWPRRRVHSLALVWPLLQQRQPQPPQFLLLRRSWQRRSRPRPRPRARILSHAA